MNKISSDFDQPILFRTVDTDVYKSSVHNGSIWLRSSVYYRQIEDQARADTAEGTNSSLTLLPLAFHPNNGNKITIQGSGSIGCEIIPHYIVSLHGISISQSAHKSFGGCTFGIKNIDRISAEILYQVSKQHSVKGYRYGQVAYHHTALALSLHSATSAMGLGGTPSEFLKSINTDVLRKSPVLPFIEQDEWRIAIFLEHKTNLDPMEPIKINVNPNNFYEYIPPSNS
ncbi:hypothetical protein [Cellvibrio sp. PSBB023]|uniref:hypothetical protein n=1 Tax=Cellvibrio sp. PSBB023 TaxID=1945512 RepID=UPI00098EC7B5|nr:hypothetical protein [Cellvibrio sp. PSBB023]AQT61531.1 hypothetical protein B0D95_16505 [Cellvibrio sp. PSBB023]